jgi:hypothetical protein
MNHSEVPTSANSKVEEANPLSGLMELLSGWTDELSPDAFDDENLAGLELNPPTPPVAKADFSALLDSLTEEKPKPIDPKPAAAPAPDQTNQKNADDMSGLLDILAGWALPEETEDTDTNSSQAGKPHKDRVSALQDMLVGPFATQLRRDLDRVDGTVGAMKQKLTEVEQRAHNASALAESLMPMISDLIDRKFAQLKAEIIASVLEAVDEQEQEISIQVSGIRDRQVS